MNNNKNDVATILTNRFIEEMQKGIIPWHRPWNGGFNGAISHSTGKPYSFINQMLLPAGEYITFDQCVKEGGKVKKGAKSEIVFMWIHKAVNVKDENGDNLLDEDGNQVIKHQYSLRYCKVFNIKDCENITAKCDPIENPNEIEPNVAAEMVILNYVSKSGIKFINDTKCAEAYYSPSRDLVNVPMMEQYTDIEEYYSTTFHELTHSTGHSSRLDRFTTGKAAAFGGEEYSKEELTAEIGAAALVNYCGLETNKSFKNSTAYLQSWLTALKNDKNLLMSAATKAQKAVDLILE